MRTMLGAVLALPWALSAFAAGEFVPVPPDQAQGRRLVVPTWNLLVEAPADDWDWLMMPGLHGSGGNKFQAYLCRSPQSDAVFQVSAFKSYRGDLPPEFGAEFANGVAEGFKGGGWQARVVEAKPSDVPLPGSFRFVIEAADLSGRRLMAFGYVGGKGRLFALQDVTTDAVEPAAFRQLATSFRFVGEPQRDPITTLGGGLLIVTVVLTLLIGSVGWLMNRVGGRIRFNTWYVAIGVLVLGGVLLHILVFKRAASPMTPFELGRLWGRLVGGPVGLPLLFALWRAGAVRRQRHEAVRVGAESGHGRTY